MQLHIRNSMYFVLLWHLASMQHSFKNTAFIALYGIWSLCGFKSTSFQAAMEMFVLMFQIDVVTTLVEYGANVNLRDYMGFTPLFWATGSLETDCVLLF